MGLLQEGKWVDKWYDTKASNGHFVRKSSQFRNWITADGSAGPTGSSGQGQGGRLFLETPNFDSYANEALYSTDQIFTELKDINLLEKYTKNQEASSIAMVGFALLK